jgi:hypothetical protein
MSRFVAIIIFLLSPALLAAPDHLCLAPRSGAMPAWWTNRGPAQKESRWTGATVRNLVAGDHQARLRTLWNPSGETVYVELRVEGDTSLDALQDEALFAFSDGTGNAPALYVHFSPLASCGAGGCLNAGAMVPGTAIQYSEATVVTSTSWSPLSPTNPSPDFFVDHPWVVVEDNGTDYTWTLSFALQVPVDAAGKIRKNLRVYGNAVAYEPGPTSGTLNELPILCTSSSMTSNDCLVHSGSAPELPDDLPTGGIQNTWTLLSSGLACFGFLTQ